MCAPNTLELGSSEWILDWVSSTFLVTYACFLLCNQMQGPSLIGSHQDQVRIIDLGVINKQCWQAGKTTRKFSLDSCLQSNTIISTFHGLDQGSVLCGYISYFSKTAQAHSSPAGITPHNKPRLNTHFKSGLTDSEYGTIISVIFWTLSSMSYFKISLWFSLWAEITAASFCRFRLKMSHSYRGRKFNQSFISLASKTSNMSHPEKLGWFPRSLWPICFCGSGRQASATGKVDEPVESDCWSFQYYFSLFFAHLFISSFLQK